MSIREHLDFYDTPDVDAFSLPPERAISAFASKGLRTTFDWREMAEQEHRAAFTVAKMADLDLLADVQASLQRALEQGTPFRQWADELIPTLQARGWWGRQRVVDPITGNTVVAQLGSPSRLQTIFRTNIQNAYAVGNWESIEENLDVAPYLLYDAIDDHRTRPEHAAWDGTVLPATHEWWKTHYPPNGWNCRCGAIQLSGDELEELGLQVSKRAPASPTETKTNPRTGQAVKVPAGVDQGWQATRRTEAGRTAQLDTLAKEKIEAMPTEAMRAAAAEGMRVAKAAAKVPQSTTPPAPAEIPWQPSMRQADAERWAAGTALPGTYLHYTAAAPKILRSGFDLGRAGEGAGAAYGLGVYLVPATESAASTFYRNLIGKDPIEAVVKVSKPHTVAIDAVVLGQPSLAGEPIKVAGTMRVDPMKVAVLKGIPGAERKLRKAMATSESVEEAVIKVLLAEGYDAVVIENPKFSEAVGGTQVIVLDPRNVVAINPAAKPVKRGK